MLSKFLSLDMEKRSRIINASMKEFARNGYQKASTNEIVKEAGISKGLLFHYFENKKQLFLFMYDYSIDLFVNELYKKINLNEKDIIMRLHQAALAKLELLKKYPEIIKFIQTSYMESSGEVRDDLDNRSNNLITASYSKVFSNIDTSMFKEGIDVSKAINIIIWTFEGLSNSVLDKLKMSPSSEIDYERVFAEGITYIELFKKCFYIDN